MLDHRPRVRLSPCPMSQARIIDGKAFGETVRERVTAEVAQLKAEHEVTPG